MSEESSRTPRSCTAFAVVLLPCAIAALVLSWQAYPVSLSPQLLLAVVGVALSEMFSLELAGISLSLSYPLVMCVIMLCGPAASGLTVALTAVNRDDLRRHKPLSILVLNFDQLVLAACAGGWAYVLLSGNRILQQPSGRFAALTAGDFLWAFYGMMGAAVVYVLVNLTLVSVGYGLYKRVSPWQVALGALPVLPAHLALPFVGFLMAQVLVVNPQPIGVVALPLFVFPLIVARQLYLRYLELRDAYVDTVRSLVGALEAKDPYTRGHSERVADYATGIGRVFGLDSASLERLQYAALLHDLGKLAVPSEVLTKPGKLTELEMDSIREHPARGAAMVSRIPHLKNLAESVGKHHEWYGGGGYPTSLEAADIPQEALILSVADCFDAMTTTRAYRAAMTRDQAVAELIRCAGTQFDPEVVKAFIEARVAAGAETDASPELGAAGSAPVTSIADGGGILS